jgi:hypothetical protein
MTKNDLAKQMAFDLLTNGCLNVSEYLNTEDLLDEVSNIILDRLEDYTIKE